MQRTRIDWVAEQSKLLRGIAEEFTRIVDDYVVQRFGGGKSDEAAE